MRFFVIFLVSIFFSACDPGTIPPDSGDARALQDPSTPAALSLTLADQTDLPTAPINVSDFHRSLQVVGSDSSGAALAGATTVLTIETRANSSAPWVVVDEEPAADMGPPSILSQLSLQSFCCNEIRINGVLDPADNGAVLQLFGMRDEALEVRTYSFTVADQAALPTDPIDTRFISGFASAAATKSNGAALDAGTSIYFETRADANSPWVQHSTPITILQGSKIDDVGEVRLNGTLDPADNGAVIQIFASTEWYAAIPH